LLALRQSPEQLIKQRMPLHGRTRCICGNGRRPAFTAPGFGGRSRAALSAFDPGEKHMHIVTNVGPLAALIAGILILVVPRLLNYIVALYLIIIGLLGLFGDHIR
jgi:hypothetical protein